jgi:hypothetical protein
MFYTPRYAIESFLRPFRNAPPWSVTTGPVLPTLLGTLGRYGGLKGHRNLWKIPRNSHTLPASESGIQLVFLPDGGQRGPGKGRNIISAHPERASES